MFSRAETLDSWPVGPCKDIGDEIMSKKQAGPQTCDSFSKINLCRWLLKGRTTIYESSVFEKESAKTWIGERDAFCRALLKLEEAGSLFSEAGVSFFLDDNDTYYQLVIPKLLSHLIRKYSHEAHCMNTALQSLHSLRAGLVQLSPSTQLLFWLLSQQQCTVYGLSTKYTQNISFSACWQPETAYWCSSYTKLYLLDFPNY